MISSMFFLRRIFFHLKEYCRWGLCLLGVGGETVRFLGSETGEGVHSLS